MNLKSSSCARGSAGLGPIRVLGKPPGWDQPVRVEMLSGTRHIQYLPQVLVTTQSGEEFDILIPDYITEPEQLQERLRQSGIENIKHARLICREEDKDRFERLATGMGNSTENWAYLPDKGTINLNAKVEITEKYYQAITKIGFHYLLKHTRYRGDEEMFAETRDFILKGGDFSNFLYTNPQQIIRRVAEGETPPDWMHIIRATDYPHEVSCDLQLFLGPGFVLVVYTLRWKNPSPLEYRFAIAHQFTYYRGGKRDGFDGEMREQVPIRRSLVI